MFLRKKLGATGGETAKISDKDLDSKVEEMLHKFYDKKI